MVARDEEQRFLCSHEDIPDGETNNEIYRAEEEENSDHQVNHPVWLICYRRYATNYF